MWPWLTLILGAALLAKCADWMVEFAVRVAHRSGVSTIVIGLTLTSIGTSVPEFASSISATLQGHPGLALGNVTGSNIANVGLILGIAALVRPLQTDRTVYDRDGFILLAASALLFGLALDNHLHRWNAALLGGFYVAYLLFLTRTDGADADHRFRSFVTFVFDFDLVPTLPTPWGPRKQTAADSAPHSEVPETDRPARRSRAVLGELLAMMAAAVGVALGAHLFVTSAATVAHAIGLPTSVVGVTLMALGTSLPELSVAVSAARRGNADLVIGNVIGSNIANTLLILAICGLIRPFEISEMSVVYTIPVMLFFCVGLLYLVRSDWHVSRTQGALALSSYVLFGVAAVAGGWT